MGCDQSEFLKQSYVRQIKRNEPPFCLGGKEFSPYDSEQNREVVLSPSGAPERPEPKSVWVGVLLQERLLSKQKLKLRERKERHSCSKRLERMSSSLSFSRWASSRITSAFSRVDPCPLCPLLLLLLLRLFLSLACQTTLAGA